MKIAVLGCGNMARALVGSWAQKVAGLEISTYTPTFTRASQLAQLTGGQAYAKISQLPEAQIYLIACKPQQFKLLAPQLKPHLPKQAIVLSILAGTNVATIQSAVNCQKVVRVMPNTPVQVGQGVSLLYCSADITKEWHSRIEQLLSHVSAVFTMDSEEQLDLLTGVSGCGPAYLFEFAHQLIHTLKEKGIKEDLAGALVTQTFVGASTLMSESSENAETLRQNVTSPNGVTYQALEIFKGYCFPQMVKEAIEAAYKRSRQLAQE